jgi:hypothetical protein
MKTPTFLLAILITVTACSSGAPAPSPSPDAPDVTGYRLRATMTQAIAPEHQFAWLPAAVITDDLVWVQAGAVPLIFPGPLVTPLIGRQLSEDGYAAIVAEARRLGLLEGDGDFTPAEVMPGMALGRIELTVDGTRHDLRGDPSLAFQCIQAPCDPAPGTPEAFATFWQALGDLSTLAGEVGPEQEYRAPSFALLVTTPVTGEPDLPGRIVAWPLDSSIAEAARPVAGGILPRCGAVSGPDVETLRAAFATADQLTNWVDQGGNPADAVFIHVRPQFAGEDVCAELFGPPA